MTSHPLLDDTVDLLKELVKTPSVSGQEDQAATKLAARLENYFPNCVKRVGHNLIVDITGKEAGQTLLLCSHIDTVGVAAGWTRDPFGAQVEGDKIYGLGANDAGASVVSMIAAARALGQPQKGRLLLCFAAEEEAGDKGFMKVEPELPRYDAAIFGEPTNMGMATAMRGAMRATMCSHGKACHASRPWEGKNACDQFVYDLQKLRSIDLKDKSQWGGTTIEPTVIRGGESTNQIPALIETTLDIRTTPDKDNDWVAAALAETGLDIKITFNRRRPMHNDTASRLVRSVREACADVADYTFNGTCDMAFATAPSIVLGPGRSERSHAADEFIVTSEIDQAIKIYTFVLQKYFTAA